jgi:DNA invertase Pin-like site-specific DNA recombinase
LANARAKGKRIGRLKTRNSVLIRELLDSGLPHREIARISKCSHGSVSLEKRVYLAEKQAIAQKKITADALVMQGLSTVEPASLVSTNLIEDQTRKDI